MDPKITELYDDYTQGGMDRRDFLRKLTLYAGSTAAALTLASLLEENNAAAAMSVPPIGDNDIYSDMISYPGETGDVQAYLSRPKEEKKYPAVIIIHENRGLQPHIQDVTRRMAKEGFLALAPDALSPLGGTPENDPDEARTMIGQLDNDKTVINFVAAVKYLETNPQSTGKVGCTGFCWGGGMTNQVAVNAPTLAAAVPYYGRQPSPEQVPLIKAPILAHYAENDPGINAGIPAFEEALKKAGIDYKIYTYPGTSHGFNNDTNPERYNAEAAKLAWDRTVEFFKAKLK
jgi:carboxymethylenebutenolidase